MKTLIVNADDFGLTPGINRGIVHAHLRGILTSATLMANGAAFCQALDLAREHPSLGVGCHLTLIGGPPVSSPDKIPSLVDEEKLLPPTVREFFWRLALGRIKREEIYRELRAQVEKIFKSGICVTHFDSHKHVHGHPVVFEAVLKLAQEFKVRAIRNTRESPLKLKSLTHLGRRSRIKHWWRYQEKLPLRLLTRRTQRRLGNGTIAHPHHFFGVSQTGFLDAALMDNLLNGLPDGVSELMTHPGYPDEELDKVRTRLRRQREEEVRLLTDPRWQSKVQELGIRLETFSVLEDDGKQ